MSAAAAGIAALSGALVVIGARRLTGARPRLAAAEPGRDGRREPVVARWAAGRRLAARLARAGVPVGPDAFVAATVLAVVAAAAAGLVVLRMPIAALAGAGAVAAAAAAVVRSADRRHVGRVEAQLPGVAQQLAAGLAAGLSLRQALTRAARDAPEPARQELGRVVAELELGSRIEAALEGLVARVPSHDLRIMVTAILVQRRTGGNLARALGALAERLEERGRLARELRGATAQARMTAWMVAALPLGGGVLTEVVAPGTLARTLGAGVGPALLLVATSLYGAGVLAIRRIGRVEP
ncbi:type II secretion system F family protein [Miltoncostaea marina]|uniref:type II secretion system F family protein n=1 Tax=Miltoncostaea marina TaxID=2843215 RepID=UPI001C3E3763|nr:type II secretion system F family protein [Miltoncostaea marina]